MPLLAALLALTDWRAPYARAWTSPSGEYVASIAPAPDKKGWQVRLSGLAADAGLSPMWRATVDYCPHQAYVSDDGHLVTVGEYPGYAHRAAVAVFGDDGRLLRRYVVEDLVPKAEFDALPGDEGLKPKRWVQVAWFDSILNVATTPATIHKPAVDRKVGAVAVHNEFPKAFRLRTTTGRDLWFDLVTGEKAETAAR